MIQWLLFFTSATAIGLLTGKSMKLRFWGCVVGALSQPFWFATGYQNAQWAICVLSFWYLGSYLRGIRSNWIW